MSTKKSSNDHWDRIAEKLFDATVELLKIFYTGIKKIPTVNLNHFLLYFGNLTSINIALIRYEYDLILIQEWTPRFISKHLISWFYGGSDFKHFIHLWIIEVILTCLILGIIETAKRNKWKKFFETIGLVNGIGQTPILIKQTDQGNFGKCFIFKSPGIGLERFQSKKSDLESLIKIPIESISNGKTPDIVKFITSKKVLPAFVDYQMVTENLELEESEFVIGDTKKGIKKTKLSKLPHLLIAGTTGGGKSVFFKQVLLTILRSSQNIEMKLIDLKGGLEFSDFKTFENISIAKSISEATTVLQKIESEMTRRFDYLEKRNKKEINPIIDQIPRIIIAVDEASVLYANRDKFSDDYEDSIMARNITDKIAKLGRAAGIHLILATQKVSKETISTSIQENISARMCFRMNTLQGSLVLLGDKRANDLPSIAGRGIWSHGQESFEVQVPFLDEETIKDFAPEKVEANHTSNSKIQSLLNKGYNHE